MTLESLLATLKSEVTRVTQVQASAIQPLPCNPASDTRVAGVSADVIETQTAPRETPDFPPGVAPPMWEIQACTPETPVTPPTIDGDHRESIPVISSRWWRLHYADCDPVRVACFPPATHAEILKRYPDIAAAEPLTPTYREPATCLSVEEEAAIRAWLALIGEEDISTIAEVIRLCQCALDTRRYFIACAAAGMPKTPELPTDRSDGKQCAKRPQWVLRGRAMPGSGAKPRIQQSTSASRYVNPSGEKP